MSFSVEAENFLDLTKRALNRARATGNIDHIESCEAILEVAEWYSSNLQCWKNGLPTEMFKGRPVYMSMAQDYLRDGREWIRENILV